MGLGNRALARAGVILDLDREGFEADLDHLLDDTEQKINKLDDDISNGGGGGGAGGGGGGVGSGVQAGLLARLGFGAGTGTALAIGAAASAAGGLLVGLVAGLNEARKEADEFNSALNTLSGALSDAAVEIFSPIFDFLNDRIRDLPFIGGIISEGERGDSLESGRQLRERVERAVNPNPDQSLVDLRDSIAASGADAESRRVASNKLDQALARSQALREVGVETQLQRDLLRQARGDRRTVGLFDGSRFNDVFQQSIGSAASQEERRAQRNLEILASIDKNGKQTVVEIRGALSSVTGGRAEAQRPAVAVAR